MSAPATIAGLPDYREQTPAVAERFRKLKERPVILEVRGLVKDFAVRDSGTTRALDNVSFRAHRREIMCVIGPSGCGKSTVLRTLNRMHEVIPGARVEGKVSLDGGVTSDAVTLFVERAGTVRPGFGIFDEQTAAAAAEAARLRELAWKLEK